MKEKKFRAKEQMLIEYEEKILKEFTEFMKPYNKMLEESGIEINCYLAWGYPDDNFQELQEQRIPIQQKKECICFLVAKIGYKETEDVEDAISIFDDCRITDYAIVTNFMFINIWGFHKYSITFFKKRIVKMVQRIIENGFESELRKLK